jgi:hypothetical protein
VVPSRMAAADSDSSSSTSYSPVTWRILESPTTTFS